MSEIIGLYFATWKDGGSFADVLIDRVTVRNRLRTFPWRAALRIRHLPGHHFPHRVQRFTIFVFPSWVPGEAGTSIVSRSHC
jgi:hypothetical protein